MVFEFQMIWGSGQTSFLGRSIVFNNRIAWVCSKWADYRRRCTDHLRHRDFSDVIVFFFSRKNPNNELIKMCVVLMTGQQIKPCKCFFAASFSWASDPRACFCPNLQHCSSWNSFWMERNTTRVAPSLDLTLLLLPFFFYLFFFIAGLFSFATFREKSPPLSGTWVNSAAASAAGARI